MRYIRIILLCIALFTACKSTELYTVSVTATNNAITAYTAKNKPVTLYECRTRDNKTILLENVIPGEKYTLLIDRCDTFNTEDDNILIIKKGR